MSVNSTVSGGAGNDKFIIQSESSYSLTRITDFVAGHDELIVEGIQPSDPSPLVIQDVYGGATVGIGSNELVFLSSVTKSQLESVNAVKTSETITTVENYMNN